LQCLAAKIGGEVKCIYGVLNRGRKMIKNLILGITLVSLAQTAGIYSAKADDDNGLRLVTGTVNARAG
jgi:hypothetical protein